MNNTLRLTLAAALITVAQCALAHSAAEHAKEAADAKKGANCAAMKGMDASKMDPNDPVMKAMMAKCSATKKHAAKKGGAMNGMDMKGMKMDTPADASKKPDAHKGH